MGIKDLLQELKGCTEHCHISEFKGKRIAVDGFVWLHKASYFCAKDLYINPGTKKIMPYLARKLKILLDNDLLPFFVFDGRSLPIKGNVNDARRQIRQQAADKIAKLTREGREDQITSTDYNSAVSIKYETVKTFISFLKKSNISYIVAPYEADAQLAYLARANYVDLVLTEDSDLLAYGTPQVLFKLNFDGYVDSIKSKDAIALFHFNDPNDSDNRRTINQSKRNKKPLPTLTPTNTEFSTFTQIKEISEKDYNDFLTFCILSGCDYAPHIKYVGPKAALSLVKENHSSIDEILNQLSLKKRVIVPPNYKQAFERAKLTFMHQKVYNIDLKKVVPLAPLFMNKGEVKPFDDYDFEFAGKIFKGNELSLHIKGEIDSHHNDGKTQKNEDDFEYNDEEEEEEEAFFDDSKMNDNFLIFTKSYKMRAKSEKVIPHFQLKQKKEGRVDFSKETIKKGEINHPQIDHNINNNNNNENDYENDDDDDNDDLTVEYDGPDKGGKNRQTHPSDRHNYYHYHDTYKDVHGQEVDKKNSPSKPLKVVNLVERGIPYNEEADEPQSIMKDQEKKQDSNSDQSNASRFRAVAHKKKSKSTKSIVHPHQKFDDDDRSASKQVTPNNRSKSSPSIEVYMSQALFNDDDDDDDDDDDTEHLTAAQLFNKINNRQGDDDDSKNLTRTKNKIRATVFLDKNDNNNDDDDDNDDELKDLMHHHTKGTVKHPISNPYEAHNDEKVHFDFGNDENGFEEPIPPPKKPKRCSSLGGSLLDSMNFSNKNQFV